ncbi:hypothetical protein E2C01_085516 [Portunus trituberculatus]|uniref:Uncharacterized protein n=1 Tax=Portunus trituberculatus TaxID=210409 RepID=A0A5B7J718_PORTR|nr:hypothetical protein [Portunus trituberculatus]
MTFDLPSVDEAMEGKREEGEGRIAPQHLGVTVHLFPCGSLTWFAPIFMVHHEQLELKYEGQIAREIGGRRVWEAWGSDRASRDDGRQQ